jgi:hypothetical protein
VGWPVAAKVVLRTITKALGLNELGFRCESKSFFAVLWECVIFVATRARRLVKSSRAKVSLMVAKILASARGRGFRPIRTLYGDSLVVLFTIEFMVNSIVFKCVSHEVSSTSWFLIRKNGNDFVHYCTVY